MLVRVCQRYREIRLYSQIYRNQSLQMLLSHEVREPIWNVIIQRGNSFRARDCNAEFSEIFQEGVFGEFNAVEKALFLSSYNFDEICDACQTQCKGSVSTFIQYLSDNDSMTPQDFMSGWPSQLFSQNLFIDNVVCRSVSR